MHERITLISMFDKDNLSKINSIIKTTDEILCKVPFGKNVDNRYTADTLPYHFTISSWNINHKDFIIK